MEILSWNIQSGLGCDGVRDIYRIIDFINEQDNPEVICLQEVARFIPKYCPAAQQDQLDILSRAFPDYTPVWGTGMSWHQQDLPPQEFGNLTLVRSMVLDRRVHCLPMPPGEGYPQLPRVSTEAVVSSSRGVLRILNTHIAYHNPTEKRLQIEYICQLQNWAEANRENSPATRDGCYANRFRTPQAILCGDLNLTPDSTEYRLLLDSPFFDGWHRYQPGQPHPHTCGVHDRKTWTEGAHCRDYFWVTKEIAASIIDYKINSDTRSSDHQPIILSLDFDLNSTPEGVTP